MGRKNDSIKTSTYCILSATTLNSTRTPVMLQTNLPKKNANHSNRTKPLFLSFKAALVSLFSLQCDSTPSVQLKDWDATAQDSRYGVKSSWLLLTTFSDYILDFLFFEGYIASLLIVAALPVFPYFPLSVSFGGPCFSRKDFPFLDLVRREDMVRSSFPSFGDPTSFFLVLVLKIC